MSVTPSISSRASASSRDTRPAAVPTTSRARLAATVATSSAAITPVGVVRAASTAVTAAMPIAQVPADRAGAVTSAVSASRTAHDTVMPAAGQATASPQPSTCATDGQSPDA